MSRVVRRRVVVADQAGQAIATQEGFDVRRVRDAEPFVATDRAPAREDVVEKDAQLHFPGRRAAVPVDGEEEPPGTDQVRRGFDQVLPLPERLEDQPEVELLQVTEPAVDQLGGAAARADGEVALLHQRDAVAA